MMPIYIGVDGEENQGLCTGSENYWCVNNQASAEDQQATLDFLEWVITSDEGRDSMANVMDSQHRLILSLTVTQQTMYSSRQMQLTPKLASIL